METEFKAPTRVELDVADLLKALYGETPKLVKDLQEDQVICGTCNGLGVRKWDSPYGLEGDDSRKGHFPYTQEAIGPCGACYTGVQTICVHCHQPYEKSRTVCYCKEAQRLRTIESDAKEEKRRAGLKRIPYKEYAVGCMYDADIEEFIYDDGDDLDHTHTYFACTPCKDWVGVDKSDILDRIKERAAEECEEGDDMVDWAPEAEAKLETLLETWFKENVKVNEAFWPDKNVIVTVTPEDAGITWDDNGDELTFCTGGCGKSLKTDDYITKNSKGEPIGSFVYTCQECHEKGVAERERILAGGTP